MRVLFCVFGAVATWTAAIASQAEPVKLLERSVPVVVGEAQTPIQLRLDAYPPTPTSEPLTIIAAANIGDVLGALPALLEGAIDDLADGCERRARGSSGRAGISNEQLHLGVDFRIEQWFCGLGETRIARESGSVKAVFSAFVDDGVLQVSLADFSMSGLGSVARFLGLEDVVRDEVAELVAEANTELREAKLPDPLIEAGFRLHDVQVGGVAGTEASVAVTAEGPGDARTLLMIIARFLDE